MNPLERKAALALYPYFKSPSVVFDIGSNKGEWADILVNNVAEMHLFEPNLPLLHYTMVKYDMLDNVKYNEKAVFSGSYGRHEFHYFTNSNNGLSSLYYNEKWKDLPMKHGEVDFIALDWYWHARKDKIDFVKIDVEGADFEVLKGAKGLLFHKLIKFIQVEKSEHILLSGNTFDELLAYMEEMNYHAYHFNGDKFEDYTGQEAENIYFMAEQFTQNWNGEFIKNTEFLKGKVRCALEIGAFEGLTTKYICDHLLDKNYNSRVVVIDPLDDVYLPADKMIALGYDPNNQDIQWKGQHGRFLKNTRGLPVQLYRAQSRPIWKTEAFYHYRFDFIYVDGDHSEDEVFNDGMEAFRCALLPERDRPGGYILFDDYGWREDTKRGIDRVLTKLDGFYERVNLDSTYQVMIQKKRNFV